MPRPRCNAKLQIGGDRLEVDFLWAEQRLVVEADGTVDVCSIDPGFEVDLYVSTDLRTMTAIWIGLTKLGSAIRDGSVVLIGDRDLERATPRWLALSPFAVERKLA